MTDRGPGADPLPVGKVPPGLLEHLLSRSGVAAGGSGVLVGPGPGLDAAAVAVGGSTVVVAADPITMTTADIGRWAVIINANDVAVCGARPRWFCATVLVPPGTSPGALEEIFASLARGAAEVGAAVVGGHTEVSAAVTQPIVSGQMIGVVAERLVTAAGARPGDVVVQIGPCPVEGAAVLAHSGHPALASVSGDLLAAARRAVDDPGINLVDEALDAVSGGASALHDVTEGGLAAALWELAAAAGVRLEVDPGAVAWFEPGVRLCDAVGADPWKTLASGCLVAAVPPGRVDRLLGSPVGSRRAVIGRVVDGDPGVVLTDGTPVDRPTTDALSVVLG